MKIRKSILILGIASILLPSCKKFLDIKPYGKTIPKTTEEFSSLLHTIINDIDYGEAYIVGDIVNNYYFECYSDNLETNLTVYPAGNRIPSYIGAQLSSKQSVYSKLYAGIRNANIIIGYMTDTTSKEAKDVLGTAYAIRGICYYQLLKQFCEPYDEQIQNQLGLPLVQEFDMEAKPIRSSMSETIEFIEKDLKKAIEYNIQNELFRFNSDILKGYLARLYFWVEQYDKAIPYAKELLNKYPLLEKEAYKEMMTTKAEPKGNMLLKSEIYINSSDNINNNAFFSYLQARPISIRFIKLFDKTNPKNDIRYSISVGKKRLNNKVGICSMRSAEFAFILAESYYHIDKKSEALQMLNSIRSKRISPYTEYTLGTLPPINKTDYIKVDSKNNPLTPLLYSILAERRKEFYMEGDRWFELKRNGRPEFWVAKQGLKYYTQKFMYTFPLPIKDLILVDGLVQNPGYDATE